MIGLGGIGNSYYLSGMEYANRGYGADSASETKNASAMGRVQPGECETCRERKYQDGSNEMVSFKSPGKISPEESYGKVLGHEKEHVANAVAEGNKKNKDLISASVSLKTSICPECGRTYVSGGTTSVIMKTYNSDPYSQNQKSYDQEALKGQNIDYVA